jgi:hypothetical protein
VTSVIEDFDSIAAGLRELETAKTGAQPSTEQAVQAATEVGQAPQVWPYFYTGGGYTAPAVDSA